MNKPTTKHRPFGSVDINDDHFLFVQTSPSKGYCRLYFVGFTPRGHDRRLVNRIDAGVWQDVSVQAVEELARGMEKEEKNGQQLKFINGENVLSQLPGRELAVLIWVLNEDDGGGYSHEICQGWKSLAREERWWLYAKASSPGQAKGLGWRRALYFALGGPPAKPYPEIKKKPKKRETKQKQMSMLDLIKNKQDITKKS